MASTTKTALLVIDMQNVFLRMTTTALPNIVRLSNFFRDKEWPQFFTQHGHPPSDFEEPITNQLVRKWGVDGSIQHPKYPPGTNDVETRTTLRYPPPLHSTNTTSWQLIPTIASLTTPTTPPPPSIIPKNTYDAFLNTPLASQLEAAAVKRVVIVGVMTDCCCDTTARSAFNRGFETWMVADAMGSASKTQHERGLKAWEFGYRDVVSTEEVLRRLG